MKSKPYTAGRFAGFFFNWALCLILGGTSAAAQAEGWSGTGSMNELRAKQTATLLPNGKVLVAGGQSHSSAELYSPAASTWSTTGSMNSERSLFTTTLLTDGKVLAVGGLTYGDSNPTETAEVYDPAKAIWTAIASMQSKRYHHTATLLPNGKVLIAGGGTMCCQGTSNVPTATAELYDPATGAWTKTGSMHSARL